LDAVVLTALAKDPAQRYQSATELQDALEQVLAGDAAAAGPHRRPAAAVPTEPLPGLPGRTGVLPAAAGPAVRDAARRPGWPRWALPVAGLALGIGLLAVLWPDGGSTPTQGEAGPTAAPATGASSTTTPGSAATPAPSASGVETALANLSAVITAARQQGTADEEAEDLLGQADDLARVLQENPKDQDQDKDDGEDKDEGGGNGESRDAANKMTELERKVNELIGKGKIRPPATTQIQQAVAQLAQAGQQAG
jgi:serine/threonine-protein kinase